MLGKPNTSSGHHGHIWAPVPWKTQPSLASPEETHRVSLVKSWNQDDNTKDKETMTVHPTGDKNIQGTQDIRPWGIVQALAYFSPGEKSTQSGSEKQYCIQFLSLGLSAELHSSKSAPTSRGFWTKSLEYKQLCKWLSQYHLILDELQNSRVQSWRMRPRNWNKARL